VNEILVLYYVLFSRIKGASHKERLESFYSKQAHLYDSFRERLLIGREEMLETLPKFKKGAIWVDMGGGTGYNVEQMHKKGKLDQFSMVYIVDLSPSLLKLAEERKKKFGWSNVQVIEGDATSWAPSQQADLVTFSYSLSMIPPWIQAVLHAQSILKPDGYFGIVDFYVSHKYPLPGLKKHSYFVQNFWPFWFANDNIFLNRDHLPFLLYLFDKVTLKESEHNVPYIPFITVPHYILVGQKKQKND